jgi:hypothetical protein
MRITPSSSTPLRHCLTVIVTRWQTLMRIAGNPYRPELHYMRGPGPKWRARSTMDAAKAARCEAAIAASS